MMHQEPPPTPAWSTRRAGRRGAPRVVFLHGFMGTHRDWDSVVASLDVDALLVDLPGHGSTMLGEQPSLDTWAAELAGELRAAFDGPAFVVGYSLGGRLALRLAELSPDLVARVALVSASPGLEGRHQRAERAALDSKRAAAIREDFEAFRARWYAAPLFALDAAQAATAVARRDEMAPESAAALVEALSPGRQPSSWSVLDRLRGPVLVVCGERDAKYFEQTQAVASRLGDRASRAVIPAVGHALHLDAPKALSRLIEEWLNA